MEGGRLKGYLGLGSNVGDRLAHLRAARDSLAAHGVSVLRSSSVYETEPQGEILEQPDFLNACLEVDTELAPEDLLDGLEHESERLRIPHRDLLTRRFVLAPLVELDPDLALPDGTRLADALAGLEGQRVERVGSL